MSRGGGVFGAVKPQDGNGTGAEGGDIEQLRSAIVTLGQQVGLVVAEQARLAVVQAGVAADQATVTGRLVALADHGAEVLAKLDLVLDAVRATQAHVDKLTAKVMER